MFDIYNLLKTAIKSNDICTSLHPLKNPDIKT